PSYPPPPTPSYLFSSFHTTPGTTPIIFSTSNFSKMSPRPRSNRKAIAFKTPAAAARWRKMMSEGAAPQAPESSRAAPQAPESSRAASPPTVSQPVESPSPIRQVPLEDEGPKRESSA
ncbi:hypothetical protein LINGRAPRIM_LOCUS2758, partial [Linum grandiflorum]